MSASLNNITCSPVPVRTCSYSFSIFCTRSMAENGDSLQPWTVATVSAVTVLAFVAVCLRLLARFERKQKLWWDDWMIIWSMVSQTRTAVMYTRY